MARTKRGLTERQARFLNTLALGRETTEQVERRLGMARHTLRRWMAEAAFVEAWERTNEVLRLRRGADASIVVPPAGGGPGAAQAEEKPDDVPASVPAPGEVEPWDEHPGRPHHGAAPRPRRSDRDLIRARHGEEAARAFDELIRAHRRPATPRDGVTDAARAHTRPDASTPVPSQAFGATPAG